MQIYITIMPQKECGKKLKHKKDVLRCLLRKQRNKKRPIVSLAERERRGKEMRNALKMLFS